MKFVKGDEVILLSGKIGRVLELVDKQVKTYRIRIEGTEEDVYLDESKLTLRRKNLLRRLLGLKL